MSSSALTLSLRELCEVNGLLSEFIREERVKVKMNFFLLLTEKRSVWGQVMVHVVYVEVFVDDRDSLSLSLTRF